MRHWFSKKKMCCADYNKSVTYLINPKSFLPLSVNQSKHTLYTYIYMIYVPTLSFNNKIIIINRFLKYKRHFSCRMFRKFLLIVSTSHLENHLNFHCACTYIL